jgi:DNA-binding response OmpR family regulator
MTDDPLDTSALPHIRTALVVDDVRAIRRLASRLLSEEGFRVFEAADAVEALEVMQLAHGLVDVVLLDVVMPQVSGVDLGRLIRERWPDQPLVYMSAHPAEVLVRHGLSNPAVPFLAKPFTRQELLAIVGAVAARGRGQPGDVRKARPSGEI